MIQPLDLDAMRRKIAEKPAPDSPVVVSRRFLEQVEREISDGRLAAAQLSRAGCIDEVVQNLGKGARA